MSTTKFEKVIIIEYIGVIGENTKKAYNVLIMYFLRLLKMSVYVVLMSYIYAFYVYL